MPDVGLYLAEFKLKNGKSFGNYKITSLEVGHDTKVLWNEYTYPTNITLTWQGEDDPSHDDYTTAVQAFKAYVKKDRIIRSAPSGRYPDGRPYLCSFASEDHMKIMKYEHLRSLKITCTGFAKRVSEAVAAEYR